MMIRINLLII